MVHTSIEYIWPRFPWLSWLPLLPNFMEEHWSYSWIDWFHVQKRPGPSCWGSFCRCDTCPHDIWVSWCTPSNPKGHWTYVLNLLWRLQLYSYIRPQYPTWYRWSQLGRGKVNISDPSRGMHFLIPGLIRIMIWIPLVPVPLNFHKPLLQKIMHNPPLFTIPYSCFLHI